MFGLNSHPIQQVWQGFLVLVGPGWSCPTLDHAMTFSTLRLLGAFLTFTLNKSFDIAAPIFLANDVLLIFNLLNVHNRLGLSCFTVQKCCPYLLIKSGLSRNVEAKNLRLHCLHCN